MATSTPHQGCTPHRHRCPAREPAGCVVANRARAARPGVYCGSSGSRMAPPPASRCRKRAAAATRSSSNVGSCKSTYFQLPIVLYIMLLCITPRERRDRRALLLKWGLLQKKFTFGYIITRCAVHSLCDLSSTAVWYADGIKCPEARSCIEIYVSPPTVFLRVALCSAFVMKRAASNVSSCRETNVTICLVQNMLLSREPRY